MISAIIRKRTLIIGLLILILQPCFIYSQNSTQQWVNYSTSFGINDIDIEGNYVWVSSWGGLARFDKTNNTVTNFDGANSGLTHNYVTSVVIDDNGVKWIGTQGGGMVNFDGTNWNSFLVVNSADTLTYVHKLAKDYNNNIWISNATMTTSAGDELFRYDGNNFVKYTVPIGPGFLSIKTIACDPSNNLWVLTTGNGNVALKKFDGTNWVTYDTSNSALIGNPEAMAIDSLGNVWAITRNGSYAYLTKFDGITFTNYQITSISYWAALETDENNNVWLIGVGGSGLRKFDGTNFTTITGMPFPQISAFDVDSGGNYLRVSGPEVM